MTRKLLCILSLTLVLFLWSGISQMFPWGVSSTQNVSVQGIPDVDVAVSNMQHVPPNSLTTEAFDARFMGQISTYRTSRSFSWIVTQPLPKSYTHYFLKEALSQLIVAILLSIVLIASRTLTVKQRILLVFLVAGAAAAATYGQFLNWWQMPPSYALGASLNLILGWALCAFVGTRLIPSSKSA